MSDYTPELYRLALLARQRPTLLAGLLLSYQEQEELSDQKLAAFLSCPIDMLPRLALCRRPRPAPHFREDVQRIATYTQADATQLAKLIRAAEAREGRHQAMSSTSQMLMAARDRDEPELPPPSSEDDRVNE